MSWAWETSLPATEKMVLLCLCDHANDEGQCWPSMARIARKCSVTDRTVQRAIKHLREWGVLTGDHEAGKVYKFQINPRHCVTPDTVSPPTITTKPPTQCRQTPDTVSPEPLENHQQEPSEDSPADAEPSLTPDHVWEFYRSVAMQFGRPIPAKFDPDRRQLLRHRIAQNSVDDFRTVFANIRASPFLRGDKERCPLTFDWLFKPGNFRKVLEGNYNG